MSHPLISPEEALLLAGVGTERSGVNASVVFADVRWYLDGRSGIEAYEAEHIDGAIFVDLDEHLADHTQPATAGRHPLPSPEDFAAAMSTLGIGDGTRVIAYDDSGGGTAGRLVVMLRALGRAASLLDGGLRQWPGATSHGRAPTLPTAVFTPQPWPAERFATLDDVRAGSAVMFDARAADRFRGDVEPVDAAAGHIPGALSAPWAGNLDPSTGRFNEPGSIRERFGLAAAGTADLICYCGSGVSACANVLALEAAGVDGVRLFVPSWSGWSADPHNPVAKGDDVSSGSAHHERSPS